MATGRINRKVLDHIAQINKENKAASLAKDLKKEVETGKHGTQKYVLKKDPTKVKQYDRVSGSFIDDYQRRDQGGPYTGYNV
jgi:hypothetical protein